jgi:hypothetical protein
MPVDPRPIFLRRPDIAWGVLTATAVFFVAAFMKTRWRRPIEKLPLETAAH